MIDTLHRLCARGRSEAVWRQYEVTERGYVLANLHRPAVVDDPARLLAVMGALDDVARRVPVLFLAHPRTRARLTETALPLPPFLRLLEPMSYTDFVALEAGARIVITDSGGVQEETSALGVPCLTYRTTTDRPITVQLGTNRVVGVDPRALLHSALDELDRPFPAGRAPIPLWDGRAGQRAARAVAAFLATDATTPAR